MDKVSLVLSGLLSLALVILIAPGILARNRGRVLRNIALWVAIFLGLALFYKHLGPGRQDAYPAASSSAETPAPPNDGQAEEDLAGRRI